MKPINVGVHGCDDSTYVVMLMTEPEFEFLTRLATRINDNSQTTCEPRFSIDGELPKSEQLADEVEDEAI